VLGAADPRVAEYQRQCYAALAGSRPDFIWADDDVRLENHAPAIQMACFCDLCLAEYGAQCGRTWTREELGREDAVERFVAESQPYKVELAQEVDGAISLYTQGDFTDLCRGPHLQDASPIKALKLTSLAGAYWRGDERNTQLTRIYGTAFKNKTQLDEYFAMALPGHGPERVSGTIFGLLVAAGVATRNPALWGAAVSVTVQEPVPVQGPPVHPLNTDPEAGAAVSVTRVP